MFLFLLKYIKFWLTSKSLFVATFFLFILNSTHRETRKNKLWFTNVQIAQIYRNQVDKLEENV